MTEISHKNLKLSSQMVNSLSLKNDGAVKLTTTLLGNVAFVMATVIESSGILLHAGQDEVSCLQATSPQH